MSESKMIEKITQLEKTKKAIDKQLSRLKKDLERERMLQDEATREQLKKTFYGIVRNWKGLCEYRYVYNGLQLAERLSFDHTADEKLIPDEFEGELGHANDTYRVKLLDTFEDVDDFLFSYIGEADLDDPTMADLVDWYSVVKSNDMWNQEQANETTADLLTMYKKVEEDTIALDYRRRELMDYGLSENQLKSLAKRRYHEVLEILDAVYTKASDNSKGKWVHVNITDGQFERAKKVLVDNGIEEDEAGVVLQAIGYALLNAELRCE